ncbi:DUF4148 domain-containing protein [Aquabacterium sp. A08]|uniref:DUF4148 domain-containing protein n=1 Tax=Aquabacterium sp. A08 TaxID=2718532 RepID=UPI0014243A0D|nr:DUF4148 domain-containing protein [Aquabacterium sp. A08]NIC42849.1 DUF4148 domain-containing protein [Aquabacterium sp. A08]
MNRTAYSALALTVAALLTGPALAQDAPVGKTRAQVKAELAEAVRTGNVMADGETGRLMNEVYPDRYPLAAATAKPAQTLAVVAPATGGKTRAQVKAELAEAVRTGNVMADSESGRLLKDVYPDRYPLAAQPGQTREAQASDAAGFGG